jgi:hypothetical protein
MHVAHAALGRPLFGLPRCCFVSASAHADSMALVKSPGKSANKKAAEGGGLYANWIVA